jgi:hypothetical protein
MKAAAKFATAGFTAVHSWAENALYTRTATNTFKNTKCMKADFSIRFNISFTIKNQEKGEVKNLPMTGFLVPIRFL